MSDLIENGWVVIESGIPESTLDKAAEATKQPFGQDPRMTNGFKTCEAIREIAVCEGVKSYIESSYGQKCFPFQTLNFSSGSKQELHQDSLHFNSYPSGYMCAAWVALEDISIKSGPLQIALDSKNIPTHQLFELRDLHPKHRNDRNYNYKVYEKELREMLLSLDIELKTIAIKKGQALIWDTRLIHGGAPVEDEALTRLSQVTHYFFHNCLYYSPLQSDVLNGRIRYIVPLDVATGKRISISSLLATAYKNNVSLIFLLKSLLRAMIIR